MPRLARRDAPRRHEHRHDALRTEVAIAELEVELAARADDRLRGLAPIWASRSLHPHELAARVSFAAIDDATERTAGTLARRLEDDRERFLNLLIDDLAEQRDGSAVVARMLDLDGAVGIADVPGARALMDEAVEVHRTALTRHALEAASRVAGEAAQQGATVELPDRLPAPAATQVDQLATRLASGPHVDLVRALREEAVRLPTPDDPVELTSALMMHADTLSTGPLQGYARTSTAQADGLGRQAAAAGAERRPANVYASELLDGSTCGPCSLIDGTDYGPDLDRARADYPNGIYVGCEGGPRCRGTLVFVWEDEAPPTERDAGEPAPLLPEPPEPPAPPPPLEPPPAPERPVELASGRQLDRTRAEVRQQARDVQATARAHLEQADALWLDRPPPRREAGGEWDWFFSLSPGEQKRIRRSWMLDPIETGANYGPDQVAQRWAALYGGDLTGGVDLDRIMGEWLEQTRWADSAGAWARGRIPVEREYGGSFDPANILPSHHHLRDLFDNDRDRARAYLAAQRRDEAAEYAYRSLRVRPGHRAPYELTEDEYTAELADVEAAVRSIPPAADEWGEYTPDQAAAMTRLSELIPAELDDPTNPLSARDLWLRIRAIADDAGLL